MYIFIIHNKIAIIDPQHSPSIPHLSNRNRHRGAPSVSHIMPAKSKSKATKKFQSSVRSPAAPWCHSASAAAHAVCERRPVVVRAPLCHINLANMSMTRLFIAYDRMTLPVHLACASFLACKTVHGTRLPFAFDGTNLTCSPPYYPPAQHTFLCCHNK
jgi:hypothetical protein